MDQLAESMQAYNKLVRRYGRNGQAAYPMLCVWDTVRHFMAVCALPASFRGTHPRTWPAPLPQATTHLAAEPLTARPASFTHHARRHTRGGSVSSAMTSGVPVGRQSPVLLSRHRRRASHVTDAMAAAAVEAAPSPHTLEEQKRQLAAIREGPPRSAVQRVAQAVLAAVAAALAWLAGRAAAAARAAWSHPGHLALCSIGCVIMALQVALLLEHRRHAPVPHAGAGTAAGISGPEAAAQAAAALRREVANLQQTLQQLQMQGEAWQGQLQSALASAAELAQRLPRQAWGDSAP